MTTMMMMKTKMTMMMMIMMMMMMMTNKRIKILAELLRANRAQRSIVGKKMW